MRLLTRTEPSVRQTSQRGAPTALLIGGVGALGVLSVALVPVHRYGAATDVPARPVAEVAGPSGSTTTLTPLALDGTAWSIASPPAFPSERRRGAARDSSLLLALGRVEGMRFMTAKRAAYVGELLAGLRGRGAAAIPDIAAFLHRGADVDFATMRGGDRVGHRTLRLAMLDTLRDIGGSVAVGLTLETLDRTRAPLEVATLAHALEAEEPHVHRDDVLRAVDEALVRAEDAPEKHVPDVGPLFDVLRGYDVDEAVDLLQRSVPQWGEYALIALAGMPDGAGLPTVMALAETPDAPTADAALPVRILAQTSIDYPEAGDTLVGLARSGRIADELWAPMAEALSGKHLQFSHEMFDGTSLGDRDPSDGSAPRRPSRTFFVQWSNVRYDENGVAMNWSPEQLKRQLALIDDLLAVAPTETAVRALQRARTALRL